MAPLGPRILLGFSYLGLCECTLTLLAVFLSRAQLVVESGWGAKGPVPGARQH